MTEPQQATDEVAPPAIPTEIILEILEQLIEMQTPAEIAQLVTLSRNLKPFIERLLYRNVSLTSPYKMFSFLDLIRSGDRPLSFYQDRIRHVCAMFLDLEIQDAIRLVSTCRNVHTSALRGLSIGNQASHDDLTAFYSSLSILRPIRVHIYFLDALSITHPRSLDWLCRVTHLELSIKEESSELQLNAALLQCLPQLTHITYVCMSSDFVASSFAASLRLSARMVVCIVHVSDVRARPLLNERDPRIIFCYAFRWQADYDAEYALFRDCWSLKSLIEDWSHPKGSEPDIWELAEAKVEVQRKHLQRLKDLQKSS
ncbi:hypothetical protein C8J56DRAFT_331585 [Mycena floridula]|nr:hypothetical protein C8J56DRAFT_331585 [Mycena floridula]